MQPGSPGRLLAIACALAGTLACSPPVGAFEHPGGAHTRAQLAEARAAILAGREPWASAYAAVLEHADRGLEEVPSAVAVFDPPGSEDAEANAGMKKNLADDANAAYYAALAYQINALIEPDRRDRFASHAVTILNDWAATTHTIAGGRHEHRRQGNLVMSYVGTALVLAADLLWDHPGWRTADKQRFLSWTERVFRASALGISGTTNNQADWGIFAALVASHLLDDARGFDAQRARLEEIIDAQIAPDGLLPHEQKRGEKSLWYTYFALAPMTHAVEVVRNATGQSLYEHEPPSGGSLKQALDRFYSGAIDPASWPPPAQTQHPTPRGWGGNLLFAMGKVYGDPSYLRWAALPLKRRNAAWKQADLLLPRRTGAD